MLEIEIFYDNGWHVPSQSATSFFAVISHKSLVFKKFSLTEIINNIFEEKHELIFGENDNIVAGQPASILITTNNKRWQ